MQPLQIANATRVLAENQEEFLSLPVLDEDIEGINYMTSLWEPSPEEAKQLAGGGAVRLSVAGVMHPPVAISVQDMSATPSVVVTQAHKVEQWAQARKAAIADPNPETFTELSKAETALANTVR